MSASVSKKSILLLLAFALGTSLSVIAFLQLFFERSTKEVVEAWYQSEQVSLQQGNLLSSVTKIQRLIEHSSLLDSVVAVDSDGRPLIQFGASSKAKFKFLPNENSNLHLIDRGLFASSYYFSSAETGVYIFASAPLLILVTALLSVYFVAVVVSGGLLLRRAVVAEETFKSEIQLSAMRSKLAIAEALTNLAKQVAHDIRGPVSALRVAASSVDTSAERAQLILAATERVNAIADDLLSDYKQKSLTSNLAKIIKEVLDEKLLLHPNLQIQLDLFSNYFVSGDSQTLARVFSNLLNNAIEASPDNAARIAVRAEHDNSNVMVSIWDQGVGMTKQEISDVLAGKLRSEKVGGSGLGLSHAISELTKIGGGLEIRSEVGRGTTVRVILPAFVP